MTAYQVYIDLHKLGMMTCTFYFYFFFNLQTHFNSLEKTHFSCAGKVLFTACDKDRLTFNLQR